MTAEVVDVPERQRYEIVRDGAVVGHAEYQKTDELIVFTHTEVSPSLQGQGIGAQLVRGALDHARTLDLRALPICPFVSGWMSRHPDYSTLDYRAPASELTE